MFAVFWHTTSHKVFYFGFLVFRSYLLSLYSSIYVFILLVSSQSLSQEEEEMYCVPRGGATSLVGCGGVPLLPVFVCVSTSLCLSLCLSLALSLPRAVFSCCVALGRCAAVHNGIAYYVESPQLLA